MSNIAPCVGTIDDKPCPGPAVFLYREQWQCQTHYMESVQSNFPVNPGDEVVIDDPAMNSEFVPVHGTVQFVDYDADTDMAWIGLVGDDSGTTYRWTNIAKINDKWRW